MKVETGCRDTLIERLSTKALLLDYVRLGSNFVPDALELIKVDVLDEG